MKFNIVDVYFMPSAIPGQTVEWVTDVLLVVAVVRVINASSDAGKTTLSRVIQVTR